jgi:hypothetical protein
MNEREDMNTDEFADCLDRWGSDLEHWPAPQQASGRALMAASASARALLADAQHLDQWLASGAEHQVSFGLERKILEQIPSQDFLQQVVDWFSAALWRPTFAATCALLVGFMSGLALPELNDDALLDDVSMLAFSASYEELNDAQLEPQDVRE